jgi:hypothetical protein
MTISKTINLKTLFLVAFLTITLTALFAQPTKPYTFGPGDPVSSAKINSNFDLLYDWASGPIDAATLGGYPVSTTAGAANTIPVRDANGYLYLGWINTVSGDRGTTAPTRIYASNDGFIRYYTPDNFKSVMGLIHTGNFQSTNTSGVINPDNTTMNGLYYCNSVSLFGQTDGALYNQAYSSTWQGQIYQDYRTGQLAIRGKNSGTWQAWRTVRDSTNLVAGTGSTNYCAGDDSRLSNARTPTSHTLVSHTASGLTTGHFLKATGATTYGFAAHGLTAASVGAAASSHAHGNITSAGAIGTTTGLPVITTTSGVLTTGAFGTSSGQFAAGNHTHTGLGEMTRTVLFDGTSGSTYADLSQSMLNFKLLQVVATPSGGGLLVATVSPQDLQGFTLITAQLWYGGSFSLTYNSTTRIGLAGTMSNIRRVTGFK